jgi:dephospho-CoA kinase
VEISRTKVPVIGLVGGVGSGKSYLAKELRKIRRVEIIEGDAAGHEVLGEESVKQALQEKFGEGVFDARGEVNRRALGGLVFGDDATHRNNRAALESIVHPRIAKKLKEKIATARARLDLDLIVLDAALLLEAGWRPLCDRVIYVDAPETERLARVVESRGWKPDELRAREESQFSLERKRMEADEVVDNSRDAAHAVSQLDAIVSRMIPRNPS